MDIIIENHSFWEDFPVQIAFLGLGIMGSRMAANLLKAGHNVAVWNRSVGKAGQLASLGAFAAATPADAVQAGQGAEVVITMLSTPAVVEKAALGPDGFLPAMQPDTLWIDSSTVDPFFSRRMASAAEQRGVRFIDAPVTGSKEAAEKGGLRFLVGANTTDLDQAMPLLEKMGTAVVHAGERGMGSSIKLVMNLMAAQAMLAYAEGLALGEALGFTRAQMLELTMGMPHVAPLVSTKRTKIETNTYDADFPLKWMQKDLQLASQMGYEMGLAMPQTNIAKEVYRMAMRAGLAEADFAAVVQFLEKKNNGD
jgi:3-hydroxyisobutyrate dehydrogenase/glyoxylate/succinic semialdehyde reductase